MAGLINIGNGLSQGFNALGSFAGDMGAAEVKKEAELQSQMLADTLLRNREQEAFNRSISPAKMNYDVNQAKALAQGKFDVDAQPENLATTAAVARATRPTIAEDAARATATTTATKQADNAVAGSAQGLATTAAVAAAGREPISDAANRAANITAAQKNAEINAEGSTAGLSAAQAHAQAVASGTAAGSLDKYTNAIMTEVDDGNGGVTTAMVQQDKKNGQWVTADQNRTPVAGVRLPELIPGGGRSAAQINRVINSAKDALSGLQNVAALSSSAGASLMGSTGQTMSLVSASKRYLTGYVTSQEIQDANVSFVGLGRALATLDAGGVGVNEALMAQMDKLNLQQYDTQYTKMRKLAEIRQLSDNALETAIAGPLLSRDQKIYAQSLRDKMEKTIPWTPNDVSKLEMSKNPSESLSTLGVKMGLAPAPEKTAAAAPTPAATAPTTAARPAAQPTPVENQVWIDAKGNKATYRNGHWVEQ